jgi:glycosyltransferase involved in cell wall biosynthesis
MAMINNQRRPTASVILPVFNADKYVDEAIESILAQDFDDYELLLLNDGSTDKSASRLEYFAALDKRCKLYSWPNRGLIQTLNAGVELSAGELLIRMDADDICRPDRFAKQIAYMANHPECVALGSRVMLIDAEGWPIGEFDLNVLEHDEIDAAHLMGVGGSRICHPSVIMKKSALNKIGGYLDGYPHAEDIDLFLRLAEVGRVGNLGEVLLDYRQHPGSIGYRHTRIQLESAHRAVTAAYARRGLSMPPESVQKNHLGAAPSLADTHRKWGWWALRAGNSKTARKHALKAVSLAPLDKETLKLCACVLRGY